MAFNPKVRNTIITLSIIFAVGFLIAAIIIANHNPYGTEQVEISNLQAYTKGKPSDRNALMQAKYILYTTIGYNVDTSATDIAKLKDVTIRNGTFSQTDDGPAHSVSFIVDIPSLSQSYRVKYAWNTEDKDAVDEWGIAVTCLSEDDAVYPNFNCKDMSTVENSTANLGEALSLLGLDVLDESGFSTTQQRLVWEYLTDYFHKNYPSYLRVSYVDDSFAFRDESDDENDNYRSDFLMESDTGARFKITLFTKTRKTMEVSVVPFPP